MVLTRSALVTGASDHQISRWLRDIDWEDDDCGWAYPFWASGRVDEHFGIAPADVVTEARERNIK